MTEIDGEYIQALIANGEFLAEELNDIVRTQNDALWTEMDFNTATTGLKLSTLKMSSDILRDMTETNSLLRRGHRLRFMYCYARGNAFNATKKPLQAAIDDPFNGEALFSNQAYEMGMKARYTDGNRFVLKKNSTNEFYAIPLNQIMDAFVDENDASRIKYIRRVWYAQGKQFDEWYPTAQLKNSIEGSKSQFMMDDELVSANTEYTMFYKTYNRPAGQTWGIPDALAAMLWTKAYSAYLKDNATLVRAYSRIAMKVSSNTAKGRANASVRVRANAADKSVGGTAVMDGTTDVSTMPTSGSNVNFANGRPLAAMVASANCR